MTSQIGVVMCCGASELYIHRHQIMEQEIMELGNMLPDADDSFLYTTPAATFGPLLGD